jgi:hypothetical protein
MIQLNIDTGLQCTARLVRGVCIRKGFDLAPSS